MCGSVGRESEQRIGEGFGGKFAVEGKSAVLRKGVRELQGVELNICISVSKSLDQGGGRLGGARWVGRHAVADVEDIFPILAREILVRSLDYCALLALMPQAGSRKAVDNLPIASSMGELCARNMVATSSTACTCCQGAVQSCGC